MSLAIHQGSDPQEKSQKIEMKEALLKIKTLTIIGLLGMKIRAMKIRMIALLGMKILQQ